MSSAPESAVQHSTSPFKNARQVVKKVLSKSQSEGDGATVRRSIGRPELKQLDPFLMLDEFSVSAPAGFPDHPHSAIQNIKISEELQALIVPAILPRTYLNLQILQFFRTFRAHIPLRSSERRSPGGLYYLSYLDRDMLLGRSVGGGGVFIFTRAQPLL